MVLDKNTFNALMGIYQSSLEDPERDKALNDSYQSYLKLSKDNREAFVSLVSSKSRNKFFLIANALGYEVKEM